MRKIAIIATLFLLHIYVPTFAQSGVKYVLFDKEELSQNITDNIKENRTYVTIRHKEKKYPDQVIYNYNFESKTSINLFDNRKTIFKRFRKSLVEPDSMPYDVTVSITPLSKTGHKMVDVSDDVKEKRIVFMEHDLLLKETLNNLFYGTYSSLGMFDSIPEVNAKRLDIRIVVKEGNKYKLIDETTLTEAYYISYQHVYGNHNTCCGLYLNAEAIEKTGYLSLKRPNGAGLYLEPGVILESKSSLTPGKKVDVFNFWTNEAQPSFTTRNPENRNLASFHIRDGIGDFSYIQGVGIVNGNFLDFFENSTPTYSPDKTKNKNFNLHFETTKINGKNLESYFK